MTQIPAISQTSPVDQDLEIFEESSNPSPNDATFSDDSGSLSIAPANPSWKTTDVLSSGFSQKASWSLRWQLLATVLPLALLPLATVGIGSYLLTQKRATTSVAQALKGQSLLVSKAASQRLADEITFAEVFSQLPTVLDQTRRGANEAETENLTQLSIPELDSRFKETNLLAPNTTLNELLVRTVKSEGLAEIIVSEKNGFTVGYNALTSDFVQSDEDWWKQGKAQTYWISDPEYSETTGDVGINLSHVIRDPAQGTFLGVLKTFVTALEFEAVNAYLRDAGIRGSQQVQILDTSTQFVLTTFNEQGETVARSQAEPLGLTGGSVIGDIATQLIEANQGENKPNLETLRSQLQSSYSIKQVEVAAADNVDGSDSDELLVSFDYEGKKYVLSLIEGVDWVAIASMDLAEINAAGRQSLLFFGALVLALAGIATALAAGFSRQLSAPLNDLSLKARQVSEGNLDVVAQPRGSSESQTLAQTFNDLVVRIRGFLHNEALNSQRANLAAEITSTWIVNPAELPAVYDTAVEKVRDILASDRVVIYQFHPDWSGAIVAESVASKLPSAFAQKLDDPCIPEATRAKYFNEGLLISNNIETAALHPEHRALLDSLQVKSILGVPIISQQQLYGLLITHHCDETHAWQPAEIDFLRQIGVQLGVVIERANLIAQTQALAEEQRQIKESLQRHALQLLKDVDPVSQGDLTARAQMTEDEIGTIADSYNATIDNLREIVVQVQTAAQQVSNTTDVNQAAIQLLSGSASRQAEEILMALERVQEMANSVQLVAANAHKAEVAVQKAAQTVQVGDEAMNRTVEGFKTIRQTVAETTQKVKRLSEASQKITNVVNLISGFAAQTNILALNASIEASRAGGEGKGFAVVAEEVRELARQSAEATVEIENLVSNIQEETKAVMTAMEAGTQQVVMGTRLVDETRQSLTQINTVSQQISELVESIAEAAVTQSQTSGAVTETMTQVAAIATQNSTDADQVAGSFERLRTVAQTLQSEVARFKVN
ncbi:MAG TPA: methyl-accepting chemotaxis protein [Trichocoleus sp.]